MRNGSIDIFRYICAIMVVAIHTHPFSDINNELGYIFTQIIPQISVPFFFSTVGYFYVQKLEMGQNPFLPYLKRLLTTYFIWSCLYYVLDFIQWGYSEPVDFIKGCLFRFVITGSHYHFWFFPALIFAVCCTTLLFKLRLKKILIPLSIVFYTIGCLGGAYYELGSNMPILEKLYDFPHFIVIKRVLLMGFPFFINGYIVYKIKEKVDHTISNKILLRVLYAVIVIWLAEIYMVRRFEWQTDIIITFGLYLLIIMILLILLKYPLPQYKLFSEKCKRLANFTYYSHPIGMMCLSCSFSFLNMKLTETPLFVSTIILSYFLELIISKVDNKWLSKIVN